jgi:inosose dehydratase
MANIKWSYMDHWSMVTPRGLIDPWYSRKCMDRFVRQIVALGFTGYDSFLYRVASMASNFGSGSLRNVLKFMQDRGIEKFPGIWPQLAAIPHDRSTHDRGVRSAEESLKQVEGLGVEQFIIMPGSQYAAVEPVTDEKIKIIGELYNRVGELTLRHGIKLCCHHEFFCCIHSEEEIDKFYSATDPRYVFFYCDTAQHTIAGVDPVKLYMKYHDRCGGLHLKDTHYVDKTEDYRQPSDPEMNSPTTARWFWEMGTREGLVNFPKLMKALKGYNYTGWLTVEHDKADVAGGNYASSTCRAKWYIDNGLARIYE